MRATHINDGLVINFPQNKNREADVDIYDCGLGCKFIVTKPTIADSTKAKSGAFGPSPGGGRKSHSHAFDEQFKKRQKRGRHEDEDDDNQPQRQLEGLRSSSSFGSIIIQNTNGTTTITLK